MYDDYPYSTLPLAQQFFSVPVLIPSFHFTQLKLDNFAF
jgi:hypothetical protein